MKLKLRTTGEHFDAPRGIALALLSLKDSPVEIPPPPEPLPRIVTQNLDWKLFFDPRDQGTITCLWIKCLTCDMKTTVYGPTFNRKSPVVLHACCGAAARWADCPETIFDQYREWKKRAEAAKRARPANVEDEKIRRAISGYADPNAWDGDTKYVQEG